MNQNSFKKRVRPSGRGTVAAIAILLTASAILRLASGSGIAFAGNANGLASVEEDHISSDAKSDPAEERAGMRVLLAALQAREADLKERETQIAMRSKALSVVDAEIAKRLAMLEEAEIELRNTLALADNAAENDLARLTSVYESMKPKDAAALFDAMEPGFAAGFLGRMRPDAAASILAGLTPEVAYSISVILAGRNANAPKS